MKKVMEHRILPTETEDCIAFAEWLELHPKIRFSHIPMSTYTTSKKVKGRIWAMGVRPGVPDYLLIIGGRVMFIEMKRVGSTASAVSDHQRAWLKDLAAAGVTAVVCRGYDEAVSAVKKLMKI